MDLAKFRSIGVMKRTDPKEWVRDMHAYKRLRDQGLQPKHIDGSAKLEARATDRLEVEMGLSLEGSPKDRRQLVTNLKDAIDRGREVELNEL